LSEAKDRTPQPEVAAAPTIHDLTAAPAEPAPISDLTSRVARVAAPLREQVLDLLQQEILELRLRPGQRLVERELVERIGVSRTTIREVLRQLSAEGLVTTIPQKGAIVAIPSAKDAAEVYEVRALLEGLLARQFAEKASDEMVAELRAAFTKMEEEYGASGEPQELLRSKADLYKVLFDGADNDTVRSVLEGFQTRIAVLRAATLATPGRGENSLEEIRAIVEAIEARDAEAANRASSHHVEQAAKALFTSPVLDAGAGEGTDG
jgi:DNA-binding GntR family transcriptional regulator